MDSGYKVFVVDDASVNRRILESALEKIYDVESFASGSACLDRMRQKLPDLLLLDVDMPEMDGFTLCRHIKANATTQHVPVIFVSALDDLESRLAGYDAGGADFIAKPFSFPEVKKKIEIVQRVSEEKSRLRGQLDESEMLTSLVMSNLDEYAVLVKFLRALNVCEQLDAVAAAVLDLLSSFGLKGAVQFRLAGEEMTVDHQGQVTPLEASIIAHVRTLGSIATFKNRAAFNFEHATVLVSNMPIEDPDLCGRLRDHLAIAVETLEARLQALQMRSERDAAKADIGEVLQGLARVMHDSGEKYRLAHELGATTIYQLQDELRGVFASLGMSEAQEDAIQAIIETKTDRLVELYDFGGEIEKTLAALRGRLNHALGKGH
ncbi:response regulator [Propionivibrio dicarboxylicus]|uniref:Response regulator receiver domain-containing protein n=1 Tax=Propionivibrio dicarboxylicus TaxID=83767 RepID=A0A1G7V0P9_9RHOO|nr:response regulator [Propionivibrio dicarboxylicus]SDG53128.1 Response regulator receiver domain-containing protein [Propionivibrio dicarboxylicus]